MTGKSSGLAARRAAAGILSHVLEDGETLSRALALEEGRLGALKRRDRALAEQIARTALRRKGQIDDALKRFLKKPLPKKACVARAALMTGAAQVLFMRVAAHAAIDTAVQLVKRDKASRALSGLVNAVLRNIARQKEQILASQDACILNIPRWLRESWSGAYGEDAFRRIAAALMEEPALDLSLKDPDAARDVAGQLGGLALPTGTVRLEKAGSPADLPGFAEGAFWAQDAAAALPARLLGDVRGKRVLDLCAAPGGKTAQLAAAGARVTALDSSEKRLGRLRENLARLDLSADVICADVLEWEPKTPFDAVLLDAPCSATGTARRHPDVLHLKTTQLVERLARLQEKMLERALTFVRPGGFVVYCVCSLQPEEGEGQIARFLDARKGRAELARLTAGDVSGEAHFITAQGCLRTHPAMPIGASRGLDGFFAARIRRL